MIGRNSKSSDGARFYRCAFQVNTYEYVVRHNHPTPYSDEGAYNAALIQACEDNRIEIILKNKNP
jgi:hypothetical protein